MKKKYMKPEMICFEMKLDNALLNGSPNGVNSSYSSSAALSRDGDGDNDW